MLPQIDPITAAVLQLAENLNVVAAERLPVERVAGRVLAHDITADRDSPPLNVSAMDGYALRLADVTNSATLPVIAVATAGRPAPLLPAAAAVQIFTGAPVPADADCVVPREMTLETAQQMQLNVSPGDLKLHMNIRFRGENAQVGSCVLQAGTHLNSAAMAGLASVAGAEVSVHRPVRVAILNTGDELIAPGAEAQPWQIRDSNGPTLDSALGNQPWIEVIARQRVADDLESITDTLRSLAHADAILLTGGVSMGDTDHVPAAIEQLGGRIVFHRLPIRPGKPVLGAVCGAQLIVGLPGNPVSVAVTARIIAVPLLRRLGGFANLFPKAIRVEIANADTKELKLHWYRLVKLESDGRAVYVDNRGSGDLVSLAQSDGVIELPAGCSGAGPWKVWLW